MKFLTVIKPFRRRRLIGVLTTLLVSVAVLLFFRWQANHLQRVAFSSGYLLIGLVLFLAAFHWRKCLSVIPLGNASFWLQLHIYIGLFSLVVFLTHISFVYPRGAFEQLLAANYAVVFLSGLYGLYLTRSVPRKLTQIAGEVIYERVPALRRDLATSATELAFTSVRATEGTVIAEFYSNRLCAFFEKPRGWWYALFPSSRRRRILMAELAQMDRYFSESEKKIAEKLFSMLRKKDDIDYQYAMQRQLKVWLFVHIGLTYPLIVFSLVHGMLAHVFFGGR